MAKWYAVMRIKGAGLSFPVDMMTEEEFISRITPRSDGTRYYSARGTDIVFAKSMDEMQEFADKLFQAPPEVRPVHLFVIAGDVVWPGMTALGQGPAPSQKEGKSC